MLGWEIHLGSRSEKSSEEPWNLFLVQEGKLRLGSHSVGGAELGVKKAGLSISKLE